MLRKLWILPYSEALTFTLAFISIIGLFSWPWTDMELFFAKMDLWEASASWYPMHLDLSPPQLSRMAIEISQAPISVPQPKNFPKAENWTRGAHFMGFFALSSVLCCLRSTKCNDPNKIFSRHYVIGQQPLISCREYKLQDYSFQSSCHEMSSNQLPATKKRKNEPRFCSNKYGYK